MLSELINEKIPLIKIKDHYFGKCPKCGSETLCVDDSLDRFECLNCQAGGDYDDFCYLIGFPVSQPTILINEFNNQVFTANREICNYYRSKINDPKCIQYLKKRKISSALVNNFEIGYAPSNQKDLLQHLEKVYDRDVLLATGAISNNDGHISPFLYNRLTFPIKDIFGNIVGWGGRKIDNESNKLVPKYKNSAESSIFQKRNLLYGLNVAKNFSDKGIIACEGYMDVASMQTAGFKNTVASLGTALTKDQLLLIRAYTNKLYLCYDNDDAGHKATARAINIAKNLGFDIKIMVMTEFKDPDEYIKNDISKMQHLIDDAIDAETWLVKYYVNNMQIADLINLMA